MFTIDRALAPLFVRVGGLLLLSFSQRLKVGLTRAEGDPLHRPTGLRALRWGLSASAHATTGQGGCMDEAKSAENKDRHDHRQKPPADLSP
jgi:hypothetical protein